MMDLLTPAAAATIAKTYWHLQGDVRALPSYLDQNFRIRGDAGDYVLKVAHPSWVRADLDLENRAMMALAEREPDVPWPRVQFTAGGEHLLTLSVADRSCYVRVLSFVSGTTYADAMAQGVSQAHGRSLQHDLGAIVARLTLGLAGFQHPAAQRLHPWNLLHLSELREEITHVTDRALRAVVDRQMQMFCAQLPAWRERLPIAVVHNDVNDHNVIVAADAKGRWRVRSVIDFGDMCTSWRVAELAIACTYAMQHDADPVACAHAVLRGYLAHATLTHDELAALQVLIGARTCQSVLMATRAHRAQPDNPYVLVSQQGMHTLLQTLTDLAPDAIVAPFLESPHD